MNKDPVEILRMKFEALTTCSHSFTRSAKDVYTNPRTARDWKMFLLGAQSSSEPVQAKTDATVKPMYAPYWELLNIYHSVDNRITPGPIPKSVIDKAIDSVKIAVDVDHWDDPFVMKLFINRIHTLPTNTLFSVASIMTFGSRTDAQKFGKKFKEYAETQTEDFEFVTFHKSRNIYRRKATKLNMMVMDSSVPLIYN